MRRLVLWLLAAALVVTSCGAETSTTTLGVGGISGEMEALIAETERIRGLEFVDQPTVTLMTTAALATRVRQTIEDDLDPEEVAVWQAVYGLLGLLDPSVDLGAVYADLYSEQVAGFYEPDTGELLVGADGPLTPMARSIVVHELIHALTDQHFRFVDAVDAAVEEGRYDEADAIHALAEGDATYFQIVYLQSLPIGDQIAAMEESMGADTSVLDSLPPWFGEDLTFPYDAGFRFVSSLVADGGVTLVDQAYQRLPQSTEQILHPGKYLIFEPPIPANIPDIEIAGYEVFDEGSFGEWSLQLLLFEGVAAGDKAVAAGGWGGDHLRLYWNGSAVALAYVLEADTSNDAAEIADALARGVTGRMGLGSGRSGGSGVTTFDSGTGFAQVRIVDRTVTFVAASEQAAGVSLATALAEAFVAP